MEWVQTSRGLVPNGRTPVEAGYEKDGRVAYLPFASFTSSAPDVGLQHLHHALAQVPGGTMVLGKTAPHLNGCNVPFGGQEVRVSDYAILCWKTS